MKKIVTLIIVFVSALLFVFINSRNGVENENFTIASPLPEFHISSVLGTQSRVWLPKIEDTASPANSKFTAEAVLAYDLTENKLLYGKNIKKRLPMASLTKIMTAVIALQNIESDELLEVSRNAAEVGENSMGLSEGEKLKVQELLYGLMLPSGNDAAEVLAEGSPFGRDNFIYLMNKKAEELGLVNTNFTNPSGLEGDGDQYSSAYDLLVMTRYALQNQIFAKVVSTYQHNIPQRHENKEYNLYNETNLLTSYPGVKGVKTGFTYEAGLCLVTYLDYGGRKIIAVLLNAQNRRQEMKDLLDYSLRSLGVKPPPHS